MTASQTTPASYEVGYRKPPRHTQFQKGQSGNPGGRPRRLPVERLEELALYEAYRTTVVMEDGRATPMPAIQAVLRCQLQNAASGNVRAQRDILAMIRDIERIRSIASLFEKGGGDGVVVDTDDADAVDGDDADDSADDSDADNAAGGADGAEPARQQADGIDTHGERRQAEREPTAQPAVSTPQPEDAAAPPAGGRLRHRPAQEAGSGEAFCPAATVANGAPASSLHGRSPGGGAAVRRSKPAKSGRGNREPRGVRRAARVPDPARPRLQAGAPATAAERGEKLKIPC